MFKILKKMLPQSFTLNTAQKPMTSAEISHLWESLSLSYQGITICETYLLNTEDKKLQALIYAIVKGIQMIRVPVVENLLKDAGFVVPPHPASKLHKGTPSTSQEVKNSDEEIIKVLHTFTSGFLNFDGNAIGSVTTNDSIRDIFIDELKNDMKAHETLLAFALSRNILKLPPPATATVNGLNMGEAYWLWDEMQHRVSTLIMLQTFIVNTNDKDLLKLMLHGLNEINMPQLEEIEDFLRNEGFTIPSRPINRMEQTPAGYIGKITLTDSEMIDLIITASKIGINHHITAYAASVRKDVKDFFKKMTLQEIESHKRAVKLGKDRLVINPPPNTTAKRG